MRSFYVMPLLACLLLEVPRAASAASGPIENENFYVNYASFGDEFYGTSAARVIQYAAHQWLAEGGSRRNLVLAGATSDTDCGINTTNHIFAVQGYYDANDPGSRYADYTKCIFGGWRIKIYLGDIHYKGYRLALWPTTDDEFDLQALVQHELGHRIGGHVDLNPVACNMCWSLFGTAMPQRFFCAQEITRSGTVADYSFPVGNASMLYSSGWPTPSSTWGQWGSLGFSYGLGMGASLRTERYSPQQMFARKTVDTTNIDVGNYGPWQPTTIASADPTRPSLAYDWTRGYFWLFRRGVYLNHSTERNIYIYKSTNGTSWTYQGSLRDSSGTLATTRLPVAAAYDHNTDRIVVTFVAHNDNSAFSACTGTRFGCSSQINVINWAAGGTPDYSAGSYKITGNFLTSAPALACEDSATTFRCEVMGVGTDDQRQIWTIRFGINADGSWAGSSSSSSLGALTDFPVSLVANGIGRSGSFVALINYSNYLAMRTKRYASDSWSGVQYISPYTSTRLGASINISDYYDDYQILYAPY